MIAWGILVGAILGWALLDYETAGLALGAMVGALAGWSLRAAVRAEVAKAMAGLPVQPRGKAETRVAERIIPSELPKSEVADARPIPAIETPASSTDPISVAKTSNAAAGLLAVRAWFLGGNTIVRVGLVILFIGLSFLARYAASAGLFPLALRLGLVAAAGAALLGVGVRTRARRPAFALALQGTGVAAIYLTIFAAARLFDLVPVLPAFGLMIAVCVGACALALLQSSQILAVAAFAGGFAVPVLLAGAGGDDLVLFGYFTLLNLSVLFITQRRSWRGVALVGVVATFGMAALWGSRSFDPSDFALAQPFLIASVAIYAVAAILVARDAGGAGGAGGRAVDATLLFGPAVAGFGLQVGLVRTDADGPAWAAVGFGALYGLFALLTLRRRGEGLRPVHAGRTIVHTGLIAIAVGFFTLAVPLALGARWTSAAWALEAAGAVWLGVRQSRWSPRAFGLALLAVATLVFAGDFSGDVSVVPFANAGFTGAMLIAVAALAIAWWLRHSPATETPLPVRETPLAALYARTETRLARPVFLFGFAAWVAAWTIEAWRRLPPATTDGQATFAYDGSLPRLLTMLAFVASAWVWASVGRARDWRVAIVPSRATLVVIALAFGIGIVTDARILDTPDWIVWAAVIALHVRMLYLNDMSARDADPRLAATHVGGVLLGTAMAADAVRFGIDAGGLWDTSWAGVLFLLAATALLATLTRARRPSRRWPWDRHASAYLWGAGAPVAGLVYAGALATALFASGRTPPLPFVPLLNPVDLSLGLALAALIRWRQALAAMTLAPRASETARGPAALAAIAGLGFVVLTSLWLRTAHQWLGVPWDASALLDSFVVQTGLAIGWTLLALGLMVGAHRRAERPAWLAGAGLLGLVTVKLLLVDLNNAGGAERIVTFIAVGGLMLVVGYLAPLPPKARHAAKA